MREQAAELALLDMLKWLDDEHDDDNFDEMEDFHSSDGPGSFSQINPECLKSERYTRHDFLSNEEMKSIPIIGNHHDDENDQKKYSHQHHHGRRVKRQERIAIFDATNSTNKRREWILDMCTNPIRRPNKPTSCVFIESICDDEENNNAGDDGQAKMTAEEYLDIIGCTQVDGGYFVRPRCDGYSDTISMGIYNDQFCTWYAGDQVDIEDFGLGIDQSMFQEFSGTGCLDCSQSVSFVTRFSVVVFSFLFHF